MVGAAQGCVFTQDINKAIYISDAMETGTVQVNAAPARGPDHFPFQVQFSFPYWLEAGCACVLCLTTCMMHLVQFYLAPLAMLAHHAAAFPTLLHPAC